MGRPLHFPPGHLFTCTGCGKCCSVPWRVKVDPGKAESIRKTESYQRLVREGYQPLKVMDDEFELNRKSNLDCYFLRDGLCDIHAEKGFLAKPAVCQLYPFSLVVTPDGYFVSLAFTCPAVLSGTGSDASEAAEGLAETIEHAPHFFPPELVPGEMITLTGDTRIPWEQYLAFEDQVLQLAKAEDDLVSVMLYSAGAAVAAAIDGAPPDLSPADPDLTVHIHQQLEELLSLFVVNTVAALEETEDPEARQALSIALSSRERVPSDILGAEVPGYQPFAKCDELTRGILRRYVQNKVWGKTLITGPTLVVRLLLLAVCLEVFQFYYKAKNALEGVLHFSLDVVEWTFELVETRLLVHDELLLPLMEEWERIGVELGRALREE